MRLARNSGIFKAAVDFHVCFTQGDRPHYPNNWELGIGFGHITGVVDWREVGARLRRLASDHGANVVAYQISGTELRVQFFPVTDDVFKATSSQQDAKRQ